MNRDTEELPIIIGELDECAQKMENHLWVFYVEHLIKSDTVLRNQLTTSRKTSEQHLDNLMQVLHQLDELGDIMGEMLLMQDDVEVRTYAGTIFHLPSRPDVTYYSFRSNAKRR